MWLDRPGGYHTVESVILERQPFPVGDHETRRPASLARLSHVGFRDLDTDQSGESEPLDQTETRSSTASDIDHRQPTVDVQKVAQDFAVSHPRLMQRSGEVPALD